MKEFKVPNKKILDIACGTGTHVNLLHEKGFDAIGLDISKEMLSEARKKYHSLKFIKGNMKKFHLKEKFGTIICLFRSILYNENEEEMTKTLSNCYNCLEKEGILIFGTVDKSKGIDPKPWHYEYHNSDDIIFEGKWLYNQEKNIFDLEVEFNINGQIFKDSHFMGAFSLDEIKEIAEKVGFKVVIEYHKFGYPTGKEAIFICQK